MRRKLVWLILAGVILIAGSGTGFYFWRVKHAVRTYRTQLIAGGEKLTVKELLPPAVPDDQNGAELFRKAVGAIANLSKTLLETNAPYPMEAIVPGRALVRWQQPLITQISGAKATNTWPEVGAELANIAPSLALLDELADWRTIDYNFDYLQGFRGLLPMLAPLKRATQLLSIATVFALHEGDSTAAGAHLRGMLALVRANENERLAISQLVRFAISAITVGATWEFLQSPVVTETQLAALQRDWQELEFIGATENAMLMERAVSEMTLDDMRASSDEFRSVIGIGGIGPGGGGGGSGLVDSVTDFAKETWQQTKEKSREVTWRVAWSYPDQLRMLKGKQVLIETLRFVRTNQNFGSALTRQQQRLAAVGFTADDAEDSFGWLNGDVDLQHLFSQGVRSLERVIIKVMTAEVGRQLVVTAIALKRHQLRHNNLPATLAELVPEFLPAVPIDPADGQPLRYRLNGDGTFHLYSVGKDGRDNGGDPQNPNEKSSSKSWQMGRDWVWPQPAMESDLTTLRDANPH